MLLIWQGDKMIHILVAEQFHGRVSRVDFRKNTRQYIYWWQNSATDGLAGWISGRT